MLFRTGAESVLAPRTFGALAADGGGLGSKGELKRAPTRPRHGTHILMHAQRIQRCGARMGRLIGDLVDIASIELAH